MTNTANSAAVQRTVQEIGAAAASVPEDVQGVMLAWAQGYLAGRASAAKGEAPKQ